MTLTTSGNVGILQPMSLLEIGKPQPQPTVKFDSALFERHIGEYAASHPGTLRILEAGCGRHWTLDLAGVDFRLTGVDLNADAMRMRMEVGDLDETVVGDLRTVALPADSYDVAFSSFVLEHVAGAEQVLDRLTAALRPGGLLLVRVPDRDPVFGFITRNSPHWLHVQYKRRIRRSKRAGTPGHGPFPTVYDKVVSWRGMHEYCAANGLEIVDACSSNYYLRAFGPFEGLADGALRVIAMLSFGRLTADYSNLALVIQKSAGNGSAG
jgi:SAM-dependent methyltransferase